MVDDGVVDDNGSAAVPGRQSGPADDLSETRQRLARLVRSTVQRTGRIADELSKTRQRLAQTAESIARTVEWSADVHAGLADKGPEVLEHAERDRRFAAAERAAAAALRRGELPPEAARRVIRAGGRVSGEHAGPGASAGTAVSPPGSAGRTDPAGAAPSVQD